MELMTIKEFAENQFVSYEAIRRQTITYKEDLKGHIIKKGRTQYLDSYAIEFLKQKRKDNPIVIDRVDYQGELDHLEEQVKMLKDRIIALQDEINHLNKENTSLIEYKGKNELLITLREKDQERIQEATQRNDSLSMQLMAAEQANKEQKELITSLQAEANSYEKSWFGFFRKKKQ